MKNKFLLMAVALSFVAGILIGTNIQVISDSISWCSNQIELIQLRSEGIEVK